MIIRLIYTGSLFLQIPFVVQQLLLLAPAESPSPSVCAIMSGPYLSYGETLENFTSHKDCFQPEGVMILTKGHLYKIKVTGRKSANFVSS